MFTFLCSLFLTIKSSFWINAVWIYNKLSNSLLKTVFEFIKNVFLTYWGKCNWIIDTKTVGNHCVFPTVLYLRTPCDALHYSLYVFIYVLFIFISLFITTTNIQNKNAKVKTSAFLVVNIRFFDSYWIVLILLLRTFEVRGSNSLYIVGKIIC